MDCGRPQPNARWISHARIRVVLPDWRGTVTTTSRYAGNPVARSISPPIIATSSCHGINGFPNRSATAAMAGPNDSRSGLRDVAHLGAAWSLDRDKERGRV